MWIFTGNELINGVRHQIFQEQKIVSKMVLKNVIGRQKKRNNNLSGQSFLFAICVFLFLPSFFKFYAFLQSSIKRAGKFLMVP
jgi:hypothetical protein